MSLGTPYTHRMSCQRQNMQVYVANMYTCLYRERNRERES